MHDGTLRAEVSNPVLCLKGSGFVSQSEALTVFLILFRVMTRTQPIYRSYRYLRMPSHCAN